MSKNLIWFVLIVGFFGGNLIAQSPNQINYQGVARDAAGNPLANQSITLGFLINKNGNQFYSGGQPVTTNSLGLFSTTIGSSSNPLPNFGWENGSGMTLVVSINGNPLPPQPLNSVPYAFFANDVNSNLSSGVLTIGSKNYTLASTASPSITGNGIAAVNNPQPNVYVVSVAVPTINFAPAGNILSLNFGGTPITSVITPSLTGDVIGSSNSASVVALRNIPISITTPTNGQVLQLVSGVWTPTTLSASTGTNIILTGTGNAQVTPTVGNIFNVSVPSQTFTQLFNSYTSNLGGTITLVSPTITSSNANLTVSPSSGFNFNVGLVPQTFSQPNGTLVTSSLGGSFTVQTTAIPNLANDVVGPIANSTVVAIRGIPISNTNPSAGQVLTYSGATWTPSNVTVPLLSLVGNTLQSGPNTNTVNLTSLSPWVQTNSVVSLASNTNYVAIGISTVSNAGKLTVIENSSFAAIYGQNTLTTAGAGNGIWGRTSSANPNSGGVYGSNDGAGYGVHGISTNGNAAIFGDVTTVPTSSTGSGVIGRTNGANPLSAGVYGVNTGAGSGVFGVANSSNVNVGGVRAINQGSGPSFIALKTFSAGQGAVITMTNAVNSFEGLLVDHFGTGAGIKTNITNTTNNNPALQAITNGNGSNSHAVFGVAGGANSAGIYGSNTGAGNSIYGIKNNGEQGTAIYAQNNNASNASPALSAVSSSSVSYAGSFVNSSSAASLYANKFGTGTGSTAYFENTNAGNSFATLFATTTGSGFAASFLSLGNNASLYTHKTSMGTGNAAYIENMNPSNTAPTLVSVNNSSITTSAAIKARSGTATAAIGLELEDAHLKASSLSTMTTPTVVIATGGFLNTGNTFTITNNSDVRGTIIFDNTLITSSISVGGYVDINVPFIKNYSGSTTTVFLSPVIKTTNGDKYSFYVIDQTNTFFRIRIKNNTASAIPWTPADYFIINYFVIE